ncbi:MAG TPA: hypothetical protein VNY05_22100 [Candidatus Acidoferrales bacterium]|jgi:hypothetical protein|nr:hypothetical protein [Candidatus Acidoferrales bacterium]
MNIDKFFFCRANRNPGCLLRVLAGISILTALTGHLQSAVETELKEPGGRTIIRYVVEAPENIAPAETKDPARQVGLILCSAEHDRPTADEILPVREALKRLGLSDQYVLLAGHSQAQKFGPADDEPIEKLIRWAMKTYPVNPRRIYMYGKGEGGKISGEFAMLHPALITAGISYSWGWWRMPSELKDAIDPLNNAPEFYMVLGLRDLSYHLTTVRDAYQRVTAKGYHVIYREFDDLGARTYHPASNDDAIAWVTRLRNKNVPLSAGEQALLTKTQINADGFISGLALAGGAPAGVVVQKLLESPDARVRAAAAETCVHAIFSEPVMAAVGRKLTDPSANVRRAALRALAVNANWRSETAQRALIDLALNPGKAVDPDDRAGAVDGIASAVRFQIKGARQDPALFQALITLLTDTNEELRTMAANLLAPIRDGGFRGDLGRPEQKEPTGGWPHWLGNVTAKAADYRNDYQVCANPITGPADAARQPVDLYCQGGAFLLGTSFATGQAAPKDPVQAFRYTLQAAEQGYLPAQAMAGMLYAIGKGVEQSYAEAAKWWGKAAEGGHVLAAQSLSMVYRGGAGVKSDAALSEKWAKFVIEHTPEN